MIAASTSACIRLAAKGVQAVMPLEDHPWGDRGFAVQAPNGLTVYVFSNCEPNEEFKKYYLS